MEDRLGMMRHIERDAVSPGRERSVVDLQVANADFLNQNRELEDRLEILALRNRALGANAVELRARMDSAGMANTPPDQQPRTQQAEMKGTEAPHQVHDGTAPQGNAVLGTMALKWLVACAFPGGTWLQAVARAGGWTASVPHIRQSGTKGMDSGDAGAW